MPEVLPDAADQNFLYELICSQLENDGFMKSAKCLQVELNTLELTEPGDRLEKLVNMCVQIKKHLDDHFNRRTAGGSTTPKGEMMECSSGEQKQAAPGTDSPTGSTPVVDSTSKVDVIKSEPLEQLSPSLSSAAAASSSSPMSSVVSSLNGGDVLSEVAALSEMLKAESASSSLINQQMFQQHYILQQLQLHQQQLQNNLRNSCNNSLPVASAASNSIDEQAKRLSDYVLGRYKNEFVLPNQASSAEVILSSALGQIRPTTSFSQAATLATMVPKASSPVVSGASFRASPCGSLSNSSGATVGGLSLTPASLSSPTPLLDSLSVKNWTTTSTRKYTETQADIDRKRFPCRYCGRRFTQQSALQVHERTHTGEKPYRCHFCDKAFTQISNLKCHERLHTGEKPYRCQLCGKRFTQSASLRCHMRSHTGERPYLCKYCNKRFTQPASLQHHIRIHTGEKPYKCEHCGKCFTQPSSLVVHRRLHTGERPFSCKICGKSYTQAMPLKEHMRTHHLTEASPISFNIGQPFTLQNSTSLASSLPQLLLSGKLTSEPSTTAPSPTTVSQILFSSRPNTAFSSVLPTMTGQSNTAPAESNK